MNPIEGMWCHLKQYVRKHNDQTFNKMVALIHDSRLNFVEKNVYMKLFRRFWKTLHAYNEGKDYKEVLTMFFSSLCKDTIISHRAITNSSIDN
jgi:hypothetical protein